MFRLLIFDSDLEPHLTSLFRISEALVHMDLSKSASYYAATVISGLKEVHLHQSELNRAIVQPIFRPPIG